MSEKGRRSGKRASRNQGAAPGHRATARNAEVQRAVAGGRNVHALDHCLVGLALAGIALASYLTYIAWFAERPAFCTAGSDCDLVQQSRWSTLLGVPIALWGLLTYTLLAGLVWRLRRRPSAWQAALFVAVIGAAVSWYLTAISAFVIDALCAYCMASFAIANLLLILLLVRRPAHMPEHAWSKALPLPTGAAAVIVAVLFLHFSGVFHPAAGPEKPHLKALTSHLHDSGARFYGAYWCPACQQQKTLFEASASRLPYVECTPNGRRGVLNFACVANDIKDYPTWIIDGTRYTRVVPVDELARLSGFKWPPDSKREK